MKVKELIEELQKFDPEMPVYLNTQQPGPFAVSTVGQDSIHAAWDYREGKPIDVTTHFVGLS